MAGSGFADVIEEEQNDLDSEEESSDNDKKGKKDKK